MTYAEWAIDAKYIYGADEMYADWTKERDQFRADMKRLREANLIELQDMVEYQVLVAAIQKAIEQCRTQGAHTGASFKEIADGLDVVLKELAE